MDRREFLKKSVYGVTAVTAATLIDNPAIAAIDKMIKEENDMVSNSLIKISNDRCIGCGMCVSDCFMGCLTMGEDKYPTFLPGGESRCAGCQHCMTVCPKAALSWGGIDPDTLSATSFVDGGEMLAMIKSRRSVRKYRKDDVPAEKLQKIQEMLSYPPTGGNLDNLHFTIVSTREKMDAVRKMTYDGIAALTPDSPLYQLKGIVEQSLAAGRDIVYAGAPAMIVCAVNKNKVAPGCDTIDPIIALSYFELFAQSLGLGTLWDDFAVTIANTLPEVHSMLEIPKDYTLSFILPFGTPAVRYKRAPKKNGHSIKFV